MIYNLMSIALQKGLQNIVKKDPGRARQSR